MHENERDTICDPRDEELAIAAAASLNSLLDKALPFYSIKESATFHIVWNPGHPSNPRFAFSDLKLAQELREILSKHLNGQFLIMSHSPDTV